MSDHLLRTLSEMLPNADIYLVSERPWHSLKYSGLQLTFEAALPGKDYSSIVGKFTRELSERNFDLSSLFLADVAVTEQVEEENRTRLIIEALLLGD